jgi:HK97 family phage major capsid protein
MGRPIIPNESAPALGDAGDLTLVDFSKYLSVVKAGGIRSDVSIHLWFDYDVTAFRFVIRVGGQPWWSSAITPKNSVNTRSCIVKLGERA